jgi:hypothetical protein
LSIVFAHFCWQYGLDGHTPNTYLGYSIESQCRKHPFIPRALRNRQGYILAKTLRYFNPDTRAWPPEFFDLASNSTGLSFVTGSEHDHRAVSPQELAASVKNVGLLAQDDFYALLSKSLLLVGMGDPSAWVSLYFSASWTKLSDRSPTPYDALCLGIPFINPIKSVCAVSPPATFALTPLSGTKITRPTEPSGAHSTIC